MTAPPTALPEDGLRDGRHGLAAERPAVLPAELAAHPARRQVHRGPQPLHRGTRRYYPVSTTFVTVVFTVKLCVSYLMYVFFVGHFCGSVQR